MVSSIQLVYEWLLKESSDPFDPNWYYHSGLEWTSG